MVLTELISLTVSTLGGCGGLEELILTVSTLEGVVVLKELIFNSFYIGRVWWSCKELNTVGGCDGLFLSQFLLWEGVVVLKELIFNSFYFGQVWWS